jgi:hypothetical protein
MSPYWMFRTRRVGHICFIPLGCGSVISECVQCATCSHVHSVAVLALGAPQISSIQADDCRSESEGTHVGNVLSLTPAAATEILNRLRAGQFGVNVVTRIAPQKSGFQVTFDYPLADGRDWFGESQGLPIMVDRLHARELLGRTIDFRDGEFRDV